MVSQYAVLTRTTIFPYLVTSLPFMSYTRAVKTPFVPSYTQGKFEITYLLSELTEQVYCSPLSMYLGLSLPSTLTV